MMAGPMAKHLFTFSRLMTSSTPSVTRPFSSVGAVVGHDNDFVGAFAHLLFKDDQFFGTSCQYGDDAVAGSFQRLHE